MPETSLISIVLTLYNKEQYIEETLFSIYCQTYKNWELIIVDDCSTDGSFEKAKSFCKKLWIENKCTFVQNKTNLWVAKTFEKGLKYVKWEWVAMCDGDDILMKNKLEENITYCKGSRIEFCYSDLIMINDNNEVIGLSRRKHIHVKHKNTSSKSLLHKNHIVWSSIFFSAIIIPKLQEIWFPKTIYQDQWIAIFASLTAAKMWYIYKPLVYYRRCKNCITYSSITGNKEILDNHLKIIESYITIIRSILEQKKLKKEKWMKEYLQVLQVFSRFLQGDESFLQVFRIMVNTRNFRLLYRLIICYFRIYLIRK